MPIRWLENMANKGLGYHKMKLMTPKKLLIIIFSFVAGVSGVISGCDSTQITNLQDDKNITPASSTNILFEDHFSDPSSGWHQLDILEGIADYENGHYEIIVHAKNADFWAYPGLYFEDTIIEVDATTVDGPLDNNFGIICRHQDVKNFYFFIISSDGYYAIGKVINNIQTLISADKMQESDAISQGYSTNHIKAVCDGPRLSLFVNDNQLVSVQDSSLTSGDVGLLAGTFAESETSIHFDNFIVEKPKHTTQ
jgi:hypothetical protein